MPVGEFRQGQVELLAAARLLRSLADDIEKHGHRLAYSTSTSIATETEGVAGVVKQVVERAMRMARHEMPEVVAKFLRDAADVLEAEAHRSRVTDERNAHVFGDIHDRPGEHPGHALRVGSHAPGDAGALPSEVYPHESPGGLYTIHGRVQLPAGLEKASDGRHFQEANRLLHEAIKADPGYGAHLDRIAPGTTAAVRPGSNGAYRRKAPTDYWTWHHHASGQGILELIPKRDHEPGSPAQPELHPGGRGGRANWGGGRRRRPRA